MLRHLTAACLAALIALNAVSPRVAAKPPDLPDDEPIIVVVPEEAAPVAGKAYLFAGDFSGEVRSGATFEQLSTMPKEESVCPHCARPADQRVQAARDAKSMPSVLDNLRTLEKAAAEIDRARKLGAAGHYTEVIGHLDAARKLCPGSSYARRAEEVMAEIFGVGNPITLADEQEAPCCPEGCCEPLTRIRNVGACYMARIGAYCEKVQAVAKRKREVESATYDYNGFGSLDGCKSACPKCRALTITVGVNSDCGLTGSIVLNERNSDCGKCCPCEPARECESSCPKCEQMHAEVMKRAASAKSAARPVGSITIIGCARSHRSQVVGSGANADATPCAARKAAGVEEQVNGLLKACYFAVQEGRNAKAADLARQAHALDPKRVEADPLVYKLHMLAEKGQCEECETSREASPSCPKCPTEPAEDNVSLRPELPAVDPEVVVALDRVLTKRGGDEQAEAVRPEFEVQVDPPGIEIFGRLDSDAKLEERIRAETLSRQPSQEAKSSCCPCDEVAQAVGPDLLGMFLNLPPEESGRGVLTLGFDMNGITFYKMSRYAGMKILVQYRNGLPLVWIAADPTPVETD